MTSPHEAAAGVWSALGADADDLSHLHLEGDDPAYTSPFRVGTAALASIGVAALSAAGIWRERAGRWQEARVEAVEAAAAFRSERYLRVGEAAGRPLGAPSTYFRAADGRWILIHLTYRHHIERTLRLLQVGSLEEVGPAVARWSAFALEDAIVAAGGAGYALRSLEEWRAHPQGQAVAALPLLDLERLDDGAPPEGFAAGDRPLAGVRVLDLTRVIAGPVASRTLAAYGADVLRVGTPALPDVDGTVMDTCVGKRFTHLDLREEAERERLRALVRECDVVLQGYRPGALARLGVSFEECAALRPGIVFASLCAWSDAGPWAPRRGFDSLVQMASGLVDATTRWARAQAPRALPAQALDHGTGYLLAAAIMSALRRRAAAGGSQHIRLSLAQTRDWLEGLGRVECDPERPDLGEADVAPYLERMESAWGPLAYVRPPGRLSETAPAWRRPPPRPGADAPEWLPR
jgi:crotonobetainyl-CoA:carnitine CoA-transferase CaiB-like acyl-CoA transferase